MTYEPDVVPGELEAGPKLDLLIANAVMHEYPTHAWSLPRYSTDIAAAWQVVEKIQDRSNPGFTLWWDPDDVNWAAFFGVGYEAKPKAYAHTAPLAICRAALKAVTR